MRVRPTHYTMTAVRSKSWVIDVSVDGENWTMVDWKVDVQAFKDGWARSSFDIANPQVGRFIRLTQSGKNHCAYDFLSLRAFEFFGTLYE
jgi:hypothetical protein